MTAYTSILGSGGATPGNIVLGYLGGVQGGGAEDQALTQDFQAPGGIASDIARTSDTARATGLHIPVTDRVLTFDVASTPAVLGRATDESLTMEEPSGHAVDFVATSDLALMPDIVVASGPAIVSGIVYAITNPLYQGTAVGTRIYFKTESPNQEPYGLDPDVITLTVVGGPGASPVVWTYGISPEIVRLGAGSYQAIIHTDAPGTWYLWWDGTEPCEGNWSYGFSVSPVPVA